MSALDHEMMRQPHAQASLRAHFEMWVKLARHRRPLTNEILKFFALDDSQLAMKQLSLPIYELPNVHRGIARELAHWRLQFEGGDGSCYSQLLWAPTRRRIEVRPGRAKEYISFGSLFYQCDRGQKRVIIFEEGYDPPTVECMFITARGDSQALSRELASLVRWMKRHHYLRGQAVRADATLLPKRELSSWDQVALSPAVRQRIEENTLALLARRRLFKKNQIPQKRGLLLFGPPGTGKTMVGKALASSAASTFIWVTAADAQAVCSLRAVFRLARRLRPSIVFLEDLDLYASERGGGSSATLGELLSQMDGLESNDGVVVVATTNDLAAIEPALRERPSRFDAVIEIGLPDTAARREILAKQWQRQRPRAELIEHAARATSGMSGAQVRETAILAIHQAILRDSCDDAGLARLDLQDVERGVSQILGKPRRAAIGFRHARRSAPRYEPIA